MAWETLKAYIDDKIRDKLPAKISADNDHNPTLNEIVDVFGQDYIYSGITGKTLQPINDDNNRMYFTDGSVGDYLFFKDELGAVISVEEGEFVIFTGVDNVWVKRTIYNNGTFLTLPDTPSSYAGAAGNEIRVNGTGTALEFVDTPKFTESKDTELTDATTDIASIKPKTDNISTSGDGIGVSSMFAGSGEYDNSTTIDDEGFPTFWGTAQNYQSVNISMMTAKSGGVNDPDFTQYKDNGAGSAGVYAYAFAGNLEEELFFNLSMPRQWTESTDIGVDFSWVSNQTGSSAQNVKWGIEYTWANQGELFGNTSIATASDRIPSDSRVLTDTHYRTEVDVIDGTGKDINSTLVCRVYRDGGDASDTFPYDAFLLDIDFHFICNSVGSRNEHTKGVSTP